MEGAICDKGGHFKNLYRLVPALIIGVKLGSFPYMCSVTSSVLRTPSDG